RIVVFTSIQPEIEPINRFLLREVTMMRLDENVRCVFLAQPYQINRLAQSTKTSIDIPRTHQRSLLKTRNQQGGTDMFQIESGRRLRPFQQAYFAKRFGSAIHLLCILLG